jgi:hypothetical protein
MQQMARSVNLADYKSTLQYLQMSSPSGYPHVMYSTLGPPEMKYLAGDTNFVTYLAMQSLPSVSGITVDRYDITYPGGLASHGRTRMSGHIDLQTSPGAPCVYPDLMTWAFGQPVSKTFALDTFAPVYTWKLSGPGAPTATIIFGRDQCGWLITISQ